MEIKKFKPYTTSIRHKININFSLLSKKKPEKYLIKFKKTSNGRNFQGKITIRFRERGHKKFYRRINFKKKKFNILGKIVSIEYDPNRNNFISLIYYEDHTLEYMLYVKGTIIGNYISTLLFSCKKQSDIEKFISKYLGYTVPLKYLVTGCIIHNIERYPKKGAQFLRSAGSFGKIIAKEKKYVAIRLTSHEIRLFNENCFATIGILGNSLAYLQKSGKAGRSRWLGFRPKVRGSAMNVVDHPHGGGEGKTSIGKSSPLSPWGKMTLGFKTKKKKHTDFLILKKKNEKK